MTVCIAEKPSVAGDIATTGKTANAFIERMESAGAHVRMALFLAKTKNYKYKSN